MKMNIKTFSVLTKPYKNQTNVNDQGSKRAESAEDERFTGLD